MRIKTTSLALVAFFLSVVAAFATNDINLQMQAGNPSGATADATNHSHYLMQRAQYALDFNDSLGQPNWVSWDLTAGDHGSVARSDFLPDPALPAAFYAVTTDDYNGVGNINFNRGHMTPSADRNDTVTNNIPVFYMTNIVPQSADNNQGPWEVFETESRTLASAGNELLIVSGASQYLGSTIPSGKAVIPGYTWKIALVIPTGPGTAASRATTTTRVIAYKMPNINGIKGNSPDIYLTTVAQIAADTGFTFFTGLDPVVAAALRNAPIDGAPAVAAPIINTQPVAQAGPVGSTVSFSVVADANGNPPLTYQWRKDGDDIDGATAATLTLANIQAASIGNYSVVVFNTVGSTASANAALVVTGIPPSIATQPVSKSTPAGTAVTFTVAAAGSPTLAYQWRQGTTNLSNSTHITGVNSPVLTINNPQAADALSYNVVVTNTVSNVTSDAVLLTVTPAAPTITGQPIAQNVIPGGTAVFSVTATGTEPLSYQWAKGGVPIGGNASATTATLTLPGVAIGDNATSYSVAISNGVGLPATSNSAVLTVASVTGALAYNGGTYTQNFNTLPSSGTFTLSGAGPFPLSATPFNLSTLTGWSIAKTSGSGANELFTFGTGSGNGGSAYSFGTTAADRALGSLLSGTVGSSWGLVLTNNTGSTINQFTIAYTGEQWRWGGSSTAATKDRVAFEYLIGGTNILTGTFVPATGGDFSSLITSGTTGALDGNAAANRAAVTTTVTGITWTPGQVLVLRFRDTDVSGSDDGLAMDDFSFTTLVNSAPTAPSVIATSPVNGATSVAVATPISVTFDQPVNVAGSWFSLSSTNTGPITPTVNTTDFTTFTFTPPTNLAFGDTITLNLVAAQITEKASGTLHPASNTTLSFTTVIPTPPGIGTQPVAQTVPAATTATFTVTATGTAPLAYQWRKDGVAISGNTSATTPTLTLTGVQAGDMGNYDVVVTNGINPSATSTPVALTVTPVAPTITTNPVAQTAQLGANVSFTVAATGSTPFTYQWRKGGAPIVGNASASTATLTLPGIAAGDAGNYDVIVSNGTGTPATSNSVALTVNLAGPGQFAYSGGTYLQSFDTLPNTGTFTFTGTAPVRLDDSAGINAGGLGGWSFTKYAGSGSVPLFRFDNGASNSGSAYSYGTASATDRALGSLSSGTAVSRFGVTLVNNTGATLTQFSLSYIGEQWRHGGAATPNKLAFSYGVGASDINTGTFTTATPLDFTGLSVSATGSALDGNLPANRAVISATITGLSWAPGQTLVLRWTDVDDAGSDDGLAIDDLSFSATSIIPATVALSDLTQNYDGNPKSPTVNTTPAFLAVALTYNGSATVPVNAGSYTVVATVTEPGYSGSASGTFVIQKAPTTVALGGLTAAYDGTAKTPTPTTNPASLGVTYTYNGSATPPTFPGTYVVVATINDGNYTGTVTSTLVISATATLRHAPTINSGLDGSVQVVTAENVTLGGTAWVSGDLLVPGTPTVALSGTPTYGSTLDATGAATPTEFTVLIGGSAVLRHVVRRVDAVALPTVAAPPAPLGTRNIILNAPGQNAGDFATVRNLTLAGSAGIVAVPAGTYGAFTLTGNSTLVLGVAGATEPAFYNLQSLAVNLLPGQAKIQVVGPVVITVASGANFNGMVGEAAHPEWLTVRVANNGFTATGNVVTHGNIIAPTSTVTLNGAAVLNGTVVADRLVLNATSLLNDPNL